MKSLLGNTFASRSMYALLIITLVTITAFGQNLVVGNSSATFSGAGTYSVKGNITNGGVASATTINGTVTMSGAAAQTIGTATNGALTFGILNVNTTSNTTTAAVSTTVSTALSVGNGTTYDIGATTLTLGGTSTLNGSGVLNVSSGSNSVVYNSAGASQAVLGLTYAGALTLSGASTKSLSSTTSVAGAFSHSGGALTVGQNLTISSASPSFGIITNVATGMALTLSGTGAKTIGTVTNITGSGAIANSGASGLLTISTLTDNNSTSNGITGGAGGVTFTNVATNHGVITGGAGAVTFSNTLAQAGGTITAGAGTAVFSGAVTQTAGSIASAALANLLKFSGSYSNAGGGTLDLTATGAAEFDNTVTAGIFNLAGGSTVTYGGAAQAIADMGYAGNMILTGGTKTWTLGAVRTIGGNLTLQSSSATTLSGANALNVTGNVALSSNLTVANAVVFANTTSAVSGTGEIIGTVTRTHSLGAAAYTFNDASTTVQATTTPANLNSFSLTVTPSSNPNGYSAGHSINRKIVQSYANTGAFTVDIKLAYLSGEIGGANESRLRDFQNGISKADVLTTGTYTRVAAGAGFGTIDLPGIASTNITSGQELALDDRFYTFNSFSAVHTTWNDAASWDQGVVPTQYDDVVIANTFPITVPDAITASALSVTINPTTTGLTVGGGTSGVLNVCTGGLTNNSAGTGLTVNASAQVSIVGGSLTNNGAVTNNGTITVQ